MADEIAREIGISRNSANRALTKLKDWDRVTYLGRTRGWTGKIATPAS